MPRKIPELVCPAGNLPALKTAIDNGADTVYLGLKDATNARKLPPASTSPATASPKASLTPTRAGGRC